MIAQHWRDACKSACIVSKIQPLPKATVLQVQDSNVSVATHTCSVDNQSNLLPHLLSARHSLASWPSGSNSMPGACSASLALFNPLPLPAGAAVFEFSWAPGSVFKSAAAHVPKRGGWPRFASSCIASRSARLCSASRSARLCSTVCAPRRAWWCE